MAIVLKEFIIFIVAIKLFCHYTSDYRGSGRLEQMFANLLVRYFKEDYTWHDSSGSVGEDLPKLNI
ncbi:hypothetical protein M5W98_18545 [Paenibacillus apiarius]|nr:hypothetical protein [Paenibacillus apiarius]